MDKYSYTVKTDKIQKLVKKGDYAAAVKIAGTVDWEEVHSVRLLTITAAAYEHIRDYKGAIELLQMAYDESAVGKRILYKLTGLAIADGDASLAQKYYEMYLQEAPDENGRYLLRYLLAELKGESLDKRIAILETYRKYEFEEEWALRLAELYDEAGMGDACAKLCDEIILWFGVGEYVDAALKLKAKYAPLSAEQQDKIDNREFYEKRYQDVAEEYKEMDQAAEESEEIEEVTEDDGRAAAPLEEDGGAETAPQQIVMPGEDETWRGRILLVDGDSLEKAVPKVLEALSAYHEKNGTSLNGLTRIPAVKFNKLGFAAAREHIADKDLLVDGASALSDELLNDLLAYVREEGTSTVFALTDTSTELAYLDVRLGEFLKKETLPSINEAEEEEMKLDVDAVMDEPESESSGGDTKEIVPQVKAALGEADEPVLDERAAVSDTVKLDKGALDEAAAVILPENDDDYRQETIEDFFRAQEAQTPEKEELPAPAVVLQEAEQKAEEIAEAVEVKAAEEIRAAAEVREPAEPAAAAEVLKSVEQAAEEVKETAAEPKQAAEAVKEIVEEPAETVEELVQEPAEAVASMEEVLQEDTEEDASNLFTDLNVALLRDEEPGEEQQEETIEEQPEEEELLPAAPAFGSEPAEEPIDPDEELRKKAKKIQGSMSPESFLIYAKNYLTSIDCVLQEDGEDALMAAAADRLADGIALTKEEAENIIEAAADLSEKKSGLFARRYNKEGCLILKSKFIV